MRALDKQYGRATVITHGEGAFITQKAVKRSLTKEMCDNQYCHTHTHIYVYISVKVHVKVHCRQLRIRLVELSCVPSPLRAFTCRDFHVATYENYVCAALSFFVLE